MTNVIKFPTDPETLQCSCGNWTWLAVATKSGDQVEIFLVCPICEQTFPETEDDD